MRLYLVQHGDAVPEQLDPERPLSAAGRREVEAVARRISDWTSDVMLVGHLPFMGKLVAHLVAGDERKPVAAFVPGTVVCLEQGEAGHSAIMWMVRPELAPLPN